MDDRDAYKDLAFRNGLKDLEALPPSNIWEKIQPAIIRNNRFLFIRIAVTIVVLISLSVITYLVNKQNTSALGNLVVASNQTALALHNNTITSPVQVRPSLGRNISEDPLIQLTFLIHQRPNFNMLTILFAKHFNILSCRL